MPSALRHVTVWSDLEAAGGTCLGSCWPWASLTTSYRADGDDKVTGTIARSSAGASLLQSGRVLRYERADDSVEEWFLTQVRDVFGQDRVEVSALPARVFLKDRIILRSGSDLTLAGSDDLEGVIDAMLATTEWPSWITRGTVDRNPTIAYDWNQQNGLGGVLAAVDAANATELLVMAGETLRLSFRRVDATEYALDLLTDPVAGDPYIEQGKNLSAFSVRDDRTQQASAIYPVNASGATIAEAMFAVRTAAGNVMDMRDWGYRSDFLGVAFDGQWVGWYAVAPDGTTSLIVNSWVATQQIEVLDDSAWGAGNNATVRISPTSGGAATVALVDTEVTTPRGTWLPGTWSERVNWAPNAWFENWPLSGQVADWAVTGGVTVAQNSDRETGSYAADVTYAASAGALTVLPVLMPDEVVSNGGGTQTWRAGFRAKVISGPGGGLIAQYSKNGGSSWTHLASITGASYATFEGTFTTTAADLPNCPMLRLSRNASSGVVRVDRAWLFRDGVDTGDDTLQGNGPSVGFYAGQRELLRNRATGYRTYEIGVIDRHRDDPAGFPDDNLLVNQEARVVVPSRAVDTTLTVAALEVDELRRQQTTAQFGAPRRRLTDVL